MVTASLPPPSRPAVPEALICKPLALMLTGPGQVPFTLMIVLSGAFAAIRASGSLRVQFTLRVSLTWAERDALRHRRAAMEARKSLVRSSMDCLIIGKWRRCNARGSGG